MARIGPPEIPEEEPVRWTPTVPAGWLVRAVAGQAHEGDGRLAVLLGVDARQVKAARRQLQRQENHGR